jgi:hypothetical protein
MSDKTEDEQCLVSAPSKMRQWVKLSQIKEALVQSGFKTLDDQAAALGLSRSTAWSILRGKHKNSGLSSAVILRMLTRADLPPPCVRGCWSTSRTRWRVFMATALFGYDNLKNVWAMRDTTTNL